MVTFSTGFRNIWCSTWLLQTCGHECIAAKANGIGFLWQAPWQKKQLLLLICIFISSRTACSFLILESGHLTDLERTSILIPPVLKLPATPPDVLYLQDLMCPRMRISHCFVVEKSTIGQLWRDDKETERRKRVRVIKDWPDSVPYVTRPFKKPLLPLPPMQQQKLLTFPLLLRGFSRPGLTRLTQSN